MMPWLVVSTWNGELHYAIDHRPPLRQAEHLGHEAMRLELDEKQLDLLRHGGLALLRRLYPSIPTGEP